MLDNMELALWEGSVMEPRCGRTSHKPSKQSHKAPTWATVGLVVVMVIAIVSMVVPVLVVIIVITVAAAVMAAVVILVVVAVVVVVEVEVVVVVVVVVEADAFHCRCRCLDEVNVGASSLFSSLCSSPSVSLLLLMLPSLLLSMMRSR